MAAQGRTRSVSAAASPMFEEEDAALSGSVEEMFSSLTPPRVEYSGRRRTLSLQCRAQSYGIADMAPASPTCCGGARTLDRKSVDATSADAHPLGTPSPKPDWRRQFQVEPLSEHLLRKLQRRLEVDEREASSPALLGGGLAGSSRFRHSSVDLRAEAGPEGRPGMGDLPRGDTHIPCSFGDGDGSVWDAGDRFVRALAQGPHHLDLLFHETASSRDSSVDFEPHAPAMGATGMEAPTGASSTWPRQLAAPHKDKDKGSWWGSTVSFSSMRSAMRQIQELSMLEIGRQIGLPGDRDCNPSPVSPNAASTAAEDGGDARGATGGGGGGGGGDRGVSLPRTISFEGVELQDMHALRVEPEPMMAVPSGGGRWEDAASSSQSDSHDLGYPPLQPSLPAASEGGSTTSDIMGTLQAANPATTVVAAPDHPGSPVAVRDRAAEAPTAGSAPAAPAPAASAAADQGLAAVDEYLFESVFNMHPFAAAAFLRAFIACSFGLMLFHIHSLVTWPESCFVPLRGTALAEGNRMDMLSWLWLLAQVLLLVAQTPLRMKIQRALFRVSTAPDTADATRYLRVVFRSWSWHRCRDLGRVSCMLCFLGPLMLHSFALLVGGTSDGGAKDLSELQVHLLSVNSSNFLTLIMRAALVLSLLYFVQVAQPTYGGERRRRGLSEGTIQRLRRITFKASQTEETTLTQCAVCLEHYEDDEELMVLPCDPRHNFHAQCIEPWLQRMNTCPLCQRGVPDEA